MADAVKITTANARVAIELYAGLVALGWTPPGALPRPASHRCTLEQRTEMTWTVPLAYFPRYRAKCMDAECRWRGEWRVEVTSAQGDGYEHEVAPLDLVTPQTPTVGRPGGSAPTVDGPERVAPEPTGER